MFSKRLYFVDQKVAKPFQRKIFAKIKISAKFNKTHWKNLLFKNKIVFKSPLFVNQNVETFSTKDFCKNTKFLQNSIKHTEKTCCIKTQGCVRHRVLTRTENVFRSSVRLAAAPGNAS